MDEHPPHPHARAIAKMVGNAIHPKQILRLPPVRLCFQIDRSGVMRCAFIHMPGIHLPEFGLVALGHVWFLDAPTPMWFLDAPTPKKLCPDPDRATDDVRMVRVTDRYCLYDYHSGLSLEEMAQEVPGMLSALLARSPEARQMLLQRCFTHLSDMEEARPVRNSAVRRCHRCRFEELHGLLEHSI